MIRQAEFQNVLGILITKLLTRALDTVYVLQYSNQLQQSDVNV